MEALRHITRAQAEAVRQRYSTPAFAYHQAALEENARAALAFPNAFGLTVRYAMKACPTTAVLQLFDRAGLHIDASSGFEVGGLRAGIRADHISLSSQELPADFAGLYDVGVSFNACSLNQLRRFGEIFSGSDVGIRFNPGLGSGSTGKTNVGGPASSFGIWHELASEVKALAEKFHLNIFRVHTHIGSGGDPEVWQRVALMSLDLVRQFPSITVLNLGGGYKVGRMAGEPSTDLQAVGAPVRDAVAAFGEETGRELHLEIEPGTFLMANACSLVATVQDIVSTGGDGFTFLKLDSGMTEILRPSLYAAQHPIMVLPETDTGNTVRYVVVGHCCESGDLLTPAPGDPEQLQPRALAEAKVGDLCVVGGAGAYCSAMSAKNYNSFPEASEVLITHDGTLMTMRKRQTLDQMVQNENPLDL